jgi:hypothetical protein
MEDWKKRIESIVEKIIPWTLIVLIFILIIEYGFSSFVIAYNLQLWIDIIDGAVVSVFCVDLYFRYLRIKPFKKFLIESWLDILAVFPFVLMFRSMELFAGTTTASDILKAIQSALHTTIEVEKVAQDVEKVAQMETALQETKFFRFGRIVARFPRLAKAFLVTSHPKKYATHKGVHQ